MVPVASSTAVVTDLFGTFWDVLTGPGLAVMGGLLGVGIIFWAFRSLYSKFSGGRK